METIWPPIFMVGVEAVCHISALPGLIESGVTEVFRGMPVDSCRDGLSGFREHRRHPSISDALSLPPDFEDCRGIRKAEMMLGKGEMKDLD